MVCVLEIIAKHIAGIYAISINLKTTSLYNLIRFVSIILDNLVKKQVESKNNRFLGTPINEFNITASPIHWIRTCPIGKKQNTTHSYERIYKRNQLLKICTFIVIDFCIILKKLI